MSMFSALFSSGRMGSVEQALRAKDSTSAAMRAAIGHWFKLYYSGDDAKEKQEDDCLRLPVTIVNKLAKATFSEYSAKAADDKAQLLVALLHEADSIKKEVMQHCFVGGECLLKPVPVEGQWQLVSMRRDCYLPLARNGKGYITDLASTEQCTQGNKYYTLLERRTVISDKSLRILTKLYCADNGNYIGTEVPLATLPQYAQLLPELVLHGVDNIGVVQMRMPVLNTVDGSRDGISVYADAVGLIHNIYRNEWQLGREFDNGRSRVIASDEILLRDERGKATLADDLFVTIDDTAENVGITVFSPALREQSYLTRKNAYLRDIENVIGLKRGILSEVEAVERTATEVTSSAGEYNLTIIDLQEMWEGTLRSLVALCDTLGQIYKLPGSGKTDPHKDVAVDWGNGILYDEEKEWRQRMEMVAAGMLKPELALAWKFNLPCETPEDIAVIHKKYIPEMEKMLGGE